MKRLFKKTLAMLLVVILLVGTLPTVLAADTDTDATILFTHDLHSHFLPNADPAGGEYGGYARLMSVINEQKAAHPDAILVDAGDFSMGSLFQTAYATSALELRLMGAMGYDATTFGNHEYDYLQKGLIGMLNAAVKSGDPLPAIVEANYDPPVEGQDGYDPAMWEALKSYGVKDYIVIERGGVPFVLFGIQGVQSDEYAPNSGMILEDAAATAQAVVDEATAACKSTYGTEPVVVCLSHSGTEDGKGEDVELAKAVDGIDVIVSGHTHTTLHSPITVGDTHIVSAGEYGKYLGVVQMSRTADGWTLNRYELIPVDENTPADPAIAATVEAYKGIVEADYLAAYGMTFDKVLTINPYPFETVDEVYDTQHESTLGNLFADAYKHAVEQATGETVDVALTASGVIRETVPVGNVTVSDVFNAASLGVGTEGELIAVYITGKDLKNALEVDASVQPLMSAAQLFCAGVEYSFNTNRMIFNKVDYAMLRRADGTLEEIEDDKLYRIVTGMYCGQMLGTVEDKSFGLLSIIPRDAAGNPIEADELVNFVVRDAQGNPLKEWYAIAAYMEQMGGTMDAAYEKTDGRKVVYASWNPVDLLRNANIFTGIVLGVIAVVLGVIVLVVWRVIRKVRCKKAEKLTQGGEADGRNEKNAE